MTQDERWQKRYDEVVEFIQTNHRNPSETVVCLRGKLVEEYYDDLERMCTDSIMLTPNGQTVALNIPAGQWHTVKALESGTVILEVKDGRYEPIGEEDILK